MKRFTVTFLVVLLLLLGVRTALLFVARAAFDGPDVHHRDLPALPTAAQHLVHLFAIPATVDHVYYFSDASLRCDYYLRAHFPSVGEYETYKNKMLTKRSLVAAEPYDPGERLLKRFGDWWDWNSRPEAESYAIDRGDPTLPLLDFVIFDDTRQMVFWVTGED